MKRIAGLISSLLYVTVHVLLFSILVCDPVGGATGDLIPLFDGKSLDGWTAVENSDTWKVDDKNGCLVARGPRSHLFYTGSVNGADFKNFELVVEAQTEPGANSGVYFHTEKQPEKWPEKGYEVQINNTYQGHGAYRELKRTGSLYAVRNVYKKCVNDGEWFRMTIQVVGWRVCIHVNGILVVDYIEPADPVRRPEQAGRLLSHGTIALQAHDPKSAVRFRRVDIRLLPDDPYTTSSARFPDAGYGLKVGDMDAMGAAYLPFVDYHIHLRGGMTVEKAIARQAVTGIHSGVLKNIGAGWPIETDGQLRIFLNSATGRPVFVGLQVNDRDWHLKHAPELIARLDYVLGDTMIMPMPNDDSTPVKLWLPGYTIDDAEAWMERYMRHNLRVLAEPITILANPTYLPPAVEDRYDELWTDARMKRIIKAAIANKVALEINARSGLPKDRFIRMAKAMGATFSFGSNNFLSDPIDMSRCVEAVNRYGLKKSDMYVPKAKL